MTWTLRQLWRKFLSQSGQVPGDTPDLAAAEPVLEADPAAVSGFEDPQAIEAQPVQEESFIDPASLPEELKPHWKRMHGSYTKFAQERKALREQAAMVNRFQSDPEFAFQTLSQRAAQLGYQIVKPGQNGSAIGAPAQGGVTAMGNVPQEFIKAIEANLSPELAWLAPALAQASYGGVQAVLKPLHTQVEQRETERRDQEYETHEAKLTEKYPGWEDHEDQMKAIHKWLRSDTLNHPLYGSKLELLYKVATQQASSISEAARRLSAAARNRTSSSQVTTNAAPNISKAVKSAGSNEDAWNLAAKHAISELRSRGT